MGTKNNPGDYDCYANAEPDEPMFVLLARDETALYLVKAWKAIRCGDVETAVRMILEAVQTRRLMGETNKKHSDLKMIEAEKCADDMRLWTLNKLRSEINSKLAERKKDGATLISK